MKYWVYKDSRILGPFDKNTVAGLPGLDASTLVSAGESAAAGEGDWRPAGDISDLAALPLDRGAAWPIDDMSSTYGLLDKLQIETAGLISDDEFPGAAEELFQDPSMKATFGDLLSPRPTVDEAELRRAKDRASELTVQLEMLYKRVAELEAGQTNLVHRLAEKELQLRAKFVPPPAPEGAPQVAPVPLSPAKDRATELTVQLQMLYKRVAELEAGQTNLVRRLAEKELQLRLAELEVGQMNLVHRLAEKELQLRTKVVPPPVPEEAPQAAPAPSAAPLAAAAPPVMTQPSTPAAAIDWAAPPLPSPLADPPAPAVPAAAAPPAPAAPASTAPVAAPAPQKAFFEKKAFKTVPTVKSFRVVGADESAAALPPAPAMPAFAAAPALIELEPLAAAAPPPPPPPPPPPALMAAPEPFLAAPPLEAAPVPVFEVLTEAAPAPAAASYPTPAPLSPPTPAPSSMPPATLSFGAPPQGGPAAEMPSFSSSLDNDMLGAPSTEDALARLAKPAPATKASRPPRNNKPFLIGAAALVVLMAVVGVVFLRHPKELKQMTELDDGRSRIGAEPPSDDAANLPPLVKPKMAAPPVEPAIPSPAAAETARAASQAKLDAAVAAVKDFPIDGERGTVAQWLQFSYSASLDAGKETWSASETADKTYLVEYRFAPTRGDEVHYLFEVDIDRGFVIGKNLDAKSVLAGGPRVVAEKAKPKAKPRKTSRKKAPRSARRPAEPAVRSPVAAAETARAASQAEIDAAVAAVKDFPLDGERGTVAQWLQFSYSASPDAGKETWSASETADKTYLVEYRFAPSTRGDEVRYLFEVDMDRGFVIGKNLDAKSVLAGGPRVAEKAKPKAKPRKPSRKKAPRAARRPAEDVTPKEVPLLPLPTEGDLRPPAEDDGAFNSDTVNSGL